MGNTAEVAKVDITDRVICEICGAACHAISVHLTKDHSVDSQNPCTLVEYKDRFPSARLMSDQAMEMLRKRREEAAAGKNKESKSQFKLAEGAASANLSELFELGDDPAAYTKEGGEIKVLVSSVSEFPELVPEIDDEYVYPIEVLKNCVMAIDNDEPIYLFGHAGVGKTSLIEQICARTRRAFIRVQHTIDTELAHIVGQKTVEKHINEDGQAISVMGYEWGPLPLAMKNGWTYCADEYDCAPPGVITTYQAVLEGKPLLIMDAPEGERIIKPHPDFKFCGTGNTNGSGDETGLYQSTQLQNAATMERFAVEQVSYMPKEKEIEIIEARTGALTTDAELVWRFCDKVRENFPSTLSLTIGPRVAVKIAKFGLMRGDMKKGVALAYSNRLPESEKQAADEIAQRIFG